jgi:hypothetical protein
MRKNEYVTVPLMGRMGLVFVMGRIGLVFVVSSEAHFNCKSCYFVRLGAIYVYIRFKTMIVDISNK